jgi:hypothetical protein
LSAAVAGDANRKDRAANDKASLNMADSMISTGFDGFGANSE